MIIVALHNRMLCMRAGNRGAAGTMGRSGAATLAKWFCCNLTLGYEQSSNDGVGLCGGEDFELLGQGGIGIEGKSRLSFSHHVDHFDARQDDAG